MHLGSCVSHTIGRLYVLADACAAIRRLSHIIQRFFSLLSSVRISKAISPKHPPPSYVGAPAMWFNNNLVAHPCSEARTMFHIDCTQAFFVCAGYSSASCFADLSFL